MVSLSNHERLSRHSREGGNPVSGAESRSGGWEAGGVSDPLSLQGERARVRVLEALRG